MAAVAFKVAGKLQRPITTESVTTESVTTESVSTELVTTESVTTEISNYGFCSYGSHSYGSRRYSQVAMFKKGRHKKCLCSRAAHSRETLTHYANLPLILFSLLNLEGQKRAGCNDCQKGETAGIYLEMGNAITVMSCGDNFLIKSSTHCCKPAHQWLKSNEYVVSNWIWTYPDLL